jgi:hypothetical protein
MPTKLVIHKSSPNRKSQAKRSPTVFGLVKKMDYFFVAARFVESNELPRDNECEAEINDTIEHGSLLMMQSG